MRSILELDPACYTCEVEESRKRMGFTQMQMSDLLGITYRGYQDARAKQTFRQRDVLACWYLEDMINRYGRISVLK